MNTETEQVWTRSETLSDHWWRTTSKRDAEKCVMASQRQRAKMIRLLLELLVLLETDGQRQTDGRTNILTKSEKSLWASRWRCWTLLTAMENRRWLSGTGWEDTPNDISKMSITEGHRWQTHERETNAPQSFTYPAPLRPERQFVIMDFMLDSEMMRLWSEIVIIGCVFWLLV